MYKGTVRILSIPLNASHNVFKGLNSIYGLGKSRINTILQHSKILPTRILGKMSYIELNRLISTINYFRLIKGWLIHENLKKYKMDRINNMTVYQGIRHQLRLPVRGQRTRSNSRTVRRVRF